MDGWLTGTGPFFFFFFYFLTLTLSSPATFIHTLLGCSLVFLSGYDLILLPFFFPFSFYLFIYLI